VFAALLAAQGALAQEQKFYVFGNIGSGKIDFDKGPNDAALRNAGATNLSSTVNDTATAVMVGAGYKFVPQASVEVAYLAVSDYTYKAAFTQGTATDAISASGFGLNLVGYLPLGEKVDLYGKLGIWSFSVDDTATISAAGFAQAKQSSSNTTPMIGVGIEFKLTPQFAIRAEYDHFTKIGDDSTIGSSKLDYLSAGIAFSF
jgi:OOP family OmpA-OmpF porin